MCYDLNCKILIENQYTTGERGKKESKQTVDQDKNAQLVGLWLAYEKWV
jgi:hypothetical protein